MALTFRETRPDDVEELLDVRAATRESSLSREQLAQRGITPSSVAEGMASGETKGWACLDQTAIVGFCMGESASGEVLVLAVLPQYEGRGVGKALLSLAVDWLSSFHPARLWLAASPNPETRAYGFYRALGWRPIGEQDAHGDEILILPHLHTPRLELLPATITHLRAELEGREALARALAVEVPSSWPPELFDEDGVRYMLTWLLIHPADAEWGLYYLIRRATAGTGPTLIGAGGFKGAPDAEGTVEIGYSVLPEHQRQGYATEAVEGWVRFAFGSGRVTRVIGQTLPSLQPSIRVLERAGFRFAGAGEDPHAPAGERLIRYELLRPANRPEENERGKRWLS